jgi:Peptidase family M1 domain
MKLRLATALLFYGCSPAAPLTRSSPQLPAGDVAVYTGDVAIDPQSQLLTGHWSIRFIADSAAADSVALFLNRGLAVSRVFGPNVSGFASRLSDGDQVLTVRFASRLSPGAEGRIDLEYSGVPTFGSDGINRISPTWVELGLDSYWLPVFADYRKRIAGQVRIDLPPGWSAVASGTITRDGNQLVLTPGIPLIDIAFSASPTLHHTDAANASVFWTTADSPTVARVLATAESCREYLNARYGASDSLPSVRLVLAPRSGPAYARRNYIMLTDAGAIPPAALGGYICHEFAHFWSSAANSSGPENWLNEGMAEYVSSRYVRASFGQAQFDSVVARWQKMSAGPPIWTPQSTKRPSAQISYRKAPFLLSRLEERIGSAKMDQFVRRYMEERIRTTPDLIAALQDVAGRDAASWFRDELAR